jgi:hypothetical protein
MEQKHMDYSLFSSVLSKIEKGAVVILQGEGEPTLYPLFETAIDDIVGHGCRPFTVTNGSNINIDLVVNKFPEIGISIDTLNPELASENGRYNLSKVLSNLEGLLQAGYPPSNIVIYTTAYGQAIDDLKRYIGSRGIFKHLIQPLQQKDDYCYRYPDRTGKQDDSCLSVPCNFISRDAMRFFNIDGIEMPCCFIKNTDRFISIDRIKRSFDENIIPECCKGCRYLYRERGDKFSALPVPY